MNPITEVFTRRAYHYWDARYRKEMLSGRPAEAMYALDMAASCWEKLDQVTQEQRAAAMRRHPAGKRIV